MKAVAIIPARGGSKGLPRKNIRIVGGKPLIGWTIDAARACEKIDRVIVSSDDDEILAVAESFGAKTLKRPDDLSTDTARPESVFEHALQSIPQEGLPEFAVYLQPTSPLRSSQHISDAFNVLERSAADALISVYETDKKVLKSFILDTEDHLRGVLNNQAPFMNRQLLPGVYMPNGAIYIVRAKDFLKTRSYLPQNTVPYVMPESLSIDVDSIDDLARIEAALARTEE
jgi:CMP-N,N'-diacetyllegionaminic acid synthase